MPWLSVLAAPGSPSCFLHHSARISSAAHSHLLALVPSRNPQKYRQICHHPRNSALDGALGSPPTSLRIHPSAHGSAHRLIASSSNPARSYASDETLPEDDAGVLVSWLGVGPDEAAYSGFQPQLSRRALKSRRPNPSALIHEALKNITRGLYVDTPPHKKNRSCTGAWHGRRKRPGGLPQKQSRSSLDWYGLHPRTSPPSLHTILLRHLRTVTASPSTGTGLELSDEEASLLRSHGFSAHSVEQWTYSLLERRSVSAVWTFTDKNETPPLFLVLLFLRRKRMRSLALGVLLRHIRARLEIERVHWTSLQLLMVRLLRHARELWPETIPWIASLYAEHAMRIYTDAKENGRLSPTLLSGITRFSNSILSLISLPASVRPVLASLHQEKAQFEILHFMASCDPALSMTRTGFRATVRNQLAHSKTSQERTWAELKGPSWPPWKGKRTAMDEEKGYEFGVSRASRILHRMFEAGYEGRVWEDVAQIYAGWDTDFSPTIQTRTSLPHISTQSRNSDKLSALVWAARIDTTRTRREAWACFLAYEASNETASPEVYFAMFGKLYVHQLDEEEQKTKDQKAGSKPLLPGDMKEVLPDPKSPLHLVYLSDPVPEIEHLYHRMVTKGVRPSNRLLALLVGILKDFPTVLELLEANQDKFEGGMKCLLDGTILAQGNESSVPPYFIGSFIQFLCRFGRFYGHPPTKPMALPLNFEAHQLRLRLDKSYLLEYAFTLLLQYKPTYNPAWTAYLQKLCYSHRGIRQAEHLRAPAIVATYKAICALFEEIDENDLDPDDTQFQLLCTVVRYTAGTAYSGRLDSNDTQHILSTGPHFLRTVFHNLVGADIDPNDDHQREQDNAIPPCIPKPAALHAYVQTLGVLRDYEGLYSFSIWATLHHTQITERANAQHSGPQALFKTLVALRVGLEGVNGQGGASRELVELVRYEMEGVKEWGWPSDEHVAAYTAHGKK
ncbi:hypothetical protein P280DRAFT_469093 [Massarina eburnea CBS 473.64]|uniref:Uncharacterized protein n=1 Tax=Massarina eburnea CBS 473.64 TaxID=1395130 RepID=A0A6A6S1S8_9PLEO|nr:hypothetical protein P280DRAFT_469093 [Massarina eburnea CBS 473.64]